MWSYLLKIGSWPSGDSIYLDEIGSCLSQHGNMDSMVDFGGVLLL